MSGGDIAVRNASASDEGKLIRLWKDVFGDPESFIKGFYRCIDIESDVIAAYDGGRIVGMLNMVPLSLSGTDYTGRYLYAVCVDSGYRRKGIFRRMMSAAEKDTGFVMLVPANDDVAGIYRCMGYSDNIPVPGAVTVPTDIIPELEIYDGNTKRLYSAYLSAVLEGEIICSEKFFEFSVRDTLESVHDAEIYYIIGDNGDIGYLMASLYCRTLKVYEINCAKAEISVIIKRDGTPRRYALMKRISGGIAVPHKAEGLLDL